MNSERVSLSSIHTMKFNRSRNPLTFKELLFAYMPKTFFEYWISEWWFSAHLNVLKLMRITSLDLHFNLSWILNTEAFCWANENTVYINHIQTQRRSLFDCIPDKIQSYSSHCDVVMVIDNECSQNERVLIKLRLKWHSMETWFNNSCSLIDWVTSECPIMSIRIAVLLSISQSISSTCFKSSSLF